MRLVTLGGLRLEGSDFAEPQPLLLLTYVALHDTCLRKELQALFWPHQIDATRRSKSLSEALRRLKKLDPNLLESGRGRLGCHVPVDAAEFRRALTQKEYERAVALYRGPFLYGLEETRLRLGEEVSEWLSIERATLQNSFADVLLTLAEERRRQGEAAGARALVLRAFRLPHGVALPSLYNVERMHRLLLELGFPADADAVQRATAEWHGGFASRVSVKGGRPRQEVGVTSLFVGREAELTQLHEHFLAGERLVTVTGLAGIGKTELAKAFVQQSESLFDEIALVPLADLPQDAPAGALWQALADALGVKPQLEYLTEAVTGHLAAPRILLVLDNFEALLQLRGVIGQLLRACSELRILVTSRERLGLEDERVFRLSGLSLPPQGSTLAQLGRSAAGKLFLSSAARQGAVFSDEDAPLLLELCRHTVGVPLALKLVAGWTASLPLAELVERSRSDLGALSAADGEDLNAAFDLSVTLLDAETATVFRELSVFRGGFSLSAAEQLLGAKPRHLRRLLDASLLSFERDRYSLHPLLARYLYERHPAKAALRSRHATFYLTALQAAAQPERPSEKPPGSKGKVDFQTSSANIAAAWRWAVRQEWMHVLQPALPTLQRLYDLHSRPQQGLELVEEAAAALQDKGMAVALQASRAWFLLRSSRYAEAVHTAEAALTLSGGCARETCLNTLGAAYDSLGRFAEARGYFETAFTYAEPDSGEAASALTNLAINAVNRGDYAEARSRLAAAEHLFDQQGIAAKKIWCNYVGGWLALETGNTLEARLRLEQASDCAKALGLAHWALLSRAKLAHLFALEGRRERAEQLGYEVLTEARAQRSIGKEVRAHGTLGAVHLLEDEPQRALEHYRAGLKKARWTQSDPIILHHLVGVLQAGTKNSLCGLSADLYAYCKAKTPYMVYADRKVFQGLPSYDGTPVWCDLPSEQVATLILSILEEAGTSELPHLP